MSWSARALAAAGLGLLSLAASVLLAEALFRAYERRFLVEELEIGADDFDLTALRYNDADGYLPAAKPEGEFRILAFGDSFTQSATVAERAYTALLQRLLSDASGRRVRVANFGAAMTTFQDYLEEERSWGGRAAHDAVLFGVYSGNDYLETAQYALIARDQTRAARRRGRAEVRRVGPGVEVPQRYPLRMLDHLRAQWLSHRRNAPASDLYHPNTQSLPVAAYAPIQASMAPFYDPARLEAVYGGSLYWLDALVRRAAALERAGTRVAISVAPPHFAVSRAWLDPVLALLELPESALRLDLPEAVVAAVAARRGFAGPLVVFHECLRAAEERGEETYYATNTHWSVRGNEIVAQVLAARLADAWELGAGRVPPGDTPRCRSEAPAPGPEVERAVAALLGRTDAAAALRDRILAALREGERYASAEAVAALLARAGLRPTQGYIDGGVDYASRGVGRAAVRLHGHARDVASPASWLLLLVFREGELAGVGFTPPGDASADAGFQLEILEEAPPGIYGADTRLIAVTPAGEWSELPVAVGPLHRRLLP